MQRKHDERQCGDSEWNWKCHISAASEDEDHIAFNNDHVKHDMNDDLKENENTAEVTGEEHLIETQWTTMPTTWRRQKKASGRHRGRPVLRTVNEEDDFTEFHNDLVEHNTDDGMEGNQAQ